jgi:hypothetical protein
MGIDNSSSIIFGMLLSYEEFLKILKSFMRDEDEENEDFQNFYYEKIENEGRFSEKYPGLSLGMAAPFFDSDFNRRTFYLTFIEAEEIDITRCFSLIASHKSSLFKTCVDDYGLEYEDPKFISIVNVT